MVLVYDPEDHENHYPQQGGHRLVDQLEGDDGVDDEKDGYGEGHASHGVSVNWLPSKVEEEGSSNTFPSKKIKSLARFETDVMKVGSRCQQVGYGIRRA
jgi:hypothetical protein